MRDDEFEKLYAAHAEALLAFLAYRTGDRSLAEDAVADTFERVLRTRVRFDPRKSSEKTWIYTIALNIVRDRARRAAAETRALERATPPGPAPASHHPLDDIEDRDELRSALAVLSPEEREAVALRFGGDLSIPEVAKVLGTTRATAHGRVYRSLEKMRLNLLGDPPGPYGSEPGVRERRFSGEAADPDAGAVRQDSAAVHRPA